MVNKIAPRVQLSDSATGTLSIDSGAKIVVKNKLIMRLNMMLK